jgi:hypothetical protein
MVLVGIPSQLIQKYKYDEGRLLPVTLSRPPAAPTATDGDGGGQQLSTPDSSGSSDSGGGSSL